MAEHESCVGASDEWYTPPEIFTAIGLIFDLDPCNARQSFVPTARSFYKEDDGMVKTWDGLVWMNPPFGGRNGQVPWLRKFMAHGNGIALVAARTSAGWFHDVAVEADTMVFPKGKTKFVRPDGSIGKIPGTGSVLLGVGEQANEALERCKLGLFVRL